LFIGDMTEVASSLYYSSTSLHLSTVFLTCNNSVTVYVIKQKLKESVDEYLVGLIHATDKQKNVHYMIVCLVLDAVYSYVKKHFITSLQGMNC